LHPPGRTGIHGRNLRKMVTAGLGCDLIKRIVRPAASLLPPLDRSLDGELRYIRLVGMPIIENGILKRIIGTAMDVTEQEQLNQELQRREAYFRQMLDFTPQLAGVFGPNGERLYANRILLDYLGTTLPRRSIRRRGSELLGKILDGTRNRSNGCHWTKYRQRTRDTIGCLSLSADLTGLPCIAGLGWSRLGVQGRDHWLSAWSRHCSICLRSNLKSIGFEIQMLQPARRTRS